MGDFDGKRWRPYLDEEARERRDEIRDHLERNYSGPTDFLKQKLMEEEPLSLEQKIDQKKAELEDVEEDLQKLERIKQEREQQDKLRDKRELLKEKQKKLRELQDGGKSESVVREEVEQEALDGKPPRFSDDEWLEKKSDRIDRKVQSRLEKKGSESVDQLVEDVQRLQRQVANLNGGEEDYFMDLETVDEVKA